MVLASNPDSIDIRTFSRADGLFIADASWSRPSFERKTFVNRPLCDLDLLKGEYLFISPFADFGGANRNRKKILNVINVYKCSCFVFYNYSTDSNKNNNELNPLFNHCNINNSNNNKYIESLIILIILIIICCCLNIRTKIIRRNKNIFYPQRTFA